MFHVQFIHAFVCVCVCPIGPVPSEP